MGTTPSNSNGSAQQIARQTSWGTLGSPEWRKLLPTEITDIMPTTESAMHDTISPDNQYEAGSIVGLTCAPKYRGGFTGGMADELLEGALRCAWSGPISRRAAGSGATGRPTSATSVHYVVPTGTTIPVNTLVWVSGCAIPANNGLKLVSGTPSTTTIPTTPAPQAENFTAAQNVTISVCGFQFSSGDLTLTTSGGVTTMATTTKDLTQLSLVGGQPCFLGSPDAAVYAFATAADYGPIRLTATPSANAVTIEGMFGQTLASDAGTSKTVRLFFGQTLRVVAKTDGNYIEPLYQIETLIENAGAADADAYVYDENCAISTFTVAAPSKALVTMAADFLATDGPITETRRTNAASAVSPQRTVPFNTTSDINGRIYLSSGGTALTGYITSANLIVENQATENPAHGTLGSVVTSLGKVKVRAEVNAFLMDTGAVSAARNNSEVRANWWLRNSENAYVFDIPSARIANGQASFPKNEVVKIDLPVTANKDGTWTTSLIVSKIEGCPALPSRAA